MMVGRQVELNIERPDPVDPKPRIEVKGLTVYSEDGIQKLDDVSFTVNTGEIFGIAGISGCGQKENGRHLSAEKQGRRLCDGIRTAVMEGEYIADFEVATIKLEMCTTQLLRNIVLVHL